MLSITSPLERLTSNRDEMLVSVFGKRCMIEPMALDKARYTLRPNIVRQIHIAGSMLVELGSFAIIVRMANETA